MSWESKTGFFSSKPEEMRALETMSPEELTAPILGSDPLVILRLLTEVRLNGDQAKLSALLGNDDVRSAWRGYNRDREVTFEDHEYAAEIRKLIR